MNTIKIAVAAALLAVTSSAAFAAPQKHRNAHPQSAPVLQQRDVALPSEGTSSGPFWYSWSGPTKGGM